MYTNSCTFFLPIRLIFYSAKAITFQRFNSLSLEEICTHIDAVILFLSIPWRNLNRQLLLLKRQPVFVYWLFVKRYSETELCPDLNRWDKMICNSDFCQAAICTTSNMSFFKTFSLNISISIHFVLYHCKNLGTNDRLTLYMIYHLLLNVSCLFKKKMVLIIMILVLIFYLLNFALFVFFKLLFCVLHISIYHSKQYRPDPTLHKTRPQSNRRFTFVICEGLVLTKTASFQSLLWKYSGSVLKSIEV